jgi:hypothetical protein
MEFIVWFFSLVGAAFCFSAVYSAAIWWQVRGLTGLMMMFLFGSLAWLAFTTIWLYSPTTRINLLLVIALQRAGWAVAALSALVIADGYAASRNSHRALTTRLYLWFIRISEERHGT